MRTATASLPVKHTRTQQGRGGKSETRAWEVPYCHDCLEHERSYRTARYARNWGFAGIILGGLILAGSVLKASGEPHHFLIDLVVFLVLGATAGLCFLAHALFRQHVTGLQDGAEETCSSMWAAVTYDGWYGSVHTFHFTNPGFVEAVRILNPDKCLG
jgi:hypothetical protein